MEEHGIYFGACYYPEHWPEERWATDAELMKDAGVNIVRMAEFAWMMIEPEEGVFDFAWLDRAIALLSRHGIKTLLGTPTANPPKWLMDRHPDIYQRDIYGNARGFGARRHYCFNNRNYHHYVRRIVAAMAQHYANHPDVIGWQIDNELGCIDTVRCYCDSCRAAFLPWLKERYGSLEAVNEAWGTIFSSQTYTSWEQLHLPAYAVHQMHSPGMALDFRRFSSDSVAKFQRIQTELLRQYTPSHKVTTNMMGIFNQIDYYNLSTDLDIASMDIYQIMTPGEHDESYYSAVQNDMTRGFKRGNFWITEHQSGTPGATVLFRTPKPGELRRWTYQSIAHGADAIIYFRWRTITFGLEEYWHGILQHHGQPGRKYAEVRQVGQELRKLAPLLEGTSPRAKVAMLRCYDNEWQFEIQPHVKDYTYRNHFLAYYRYFFEKGIPVDVLSPEADLTGYDLVVAPNLIMAKDAVREQLHRYVEGGGHAVFDFRTGAKQWDNRMEPLKLPGLYRGLLGIAIEDYGSIKPTERNGLRLAADDTVLPEAAAHWYDVIELEGAEPLAAYTADYYAGSPAATRNRYGSGTAYYFGTEPDKAAMNLLMDGICADAGITPLLPDLPQGVEAACRIRDDEPILFVINHTVETRTVELPRTYRELLTGQELGGSVEIAGNGVLVLGRS